MKTEQNYLHASLYGFKAFDPTQLGGLSDEQRDAITRAIVAQGPALIRQGRAQRMGRNVALGGAVAAAAALVFMTQSQQAETKTDLPAFAAAPSCAADAVGTPVTHDEADGMSMAIGSRIRAKTARATQLSVVETEPCVTRLALNEGTLTLEANDLGGGTLWIDTPHGQFRATGTFMRIVTLASSTTLHVGEGKVVMSRGPQGGESIDAGQAVKIGRESVEHFTLSGEDRAGLLRAFQPPLEAVQEFASPEPAARGAQGARKPHHATKLREETQAQAQPAFSATALLIEAEGLWRKGDYEAARKGFRSAAQDKGATGEAAWVRLARLELAAGSTERALMALKARKSRMGAGALGAEALWLEVQALDHAGRGVDATHVAGTLLRDYPRSPQAAAARRLVTEGKVP